MQNLHPHVFVVGGEFASGFSKYLHDFDPFQEEDVVSSTNVEAKLDPREPRCLVVREYLFLPWRLQRSKTLTFTLHKQAMEAIVWRECNGEWKQIPMKESEALKAVWNHLDCCAGPFAEGERQRRRDERNTSEKQRRRSRSRSPKRWVYGTKTQTSCLKVPSCCKRRFLVSAHVPTTKIPGLWTPRYLIDVESMKEACPPGVYMPTWTQIPTG
jgi:hypothetical protein